MAYTRVYNMGSKSFRVSEHFHEFVAAHNRGDETMEDTLRRLIGGPHPEDVAGILSDETADAIEERIEAKREQDVDSKNALRDQF